MMKKPELPANAPASAQAGATPAAPRTPPPARPARMPPARPAPTRGEAADDQLCEAPRPEPIIGAGDRAHHLALVAGTAPVPLRRSAPKSVERLPALRPASRQACERRCGKAGQCDPASPFGCGGEYCRGFEGRLY